MVNAQFGTAQKSNTSYLFSLHIPYRCLLPSSQQENMHKVGHICGGHRSIKYTIVYIYGCACIALKLMQQKERQTVNSFGGPKTSCGK